ncbi:MAG TPA: response regulator [Thermomicrobiales bacterium]|nr:response regulator [Thermomicrobiales bacterium]
MTHRPRLEARKHSERPHVLIVSDDTSLSSFLAEGLPLGGFWTSVIASGLQALEVFRLRQFDLIVIDWSLQSFGALEFLRRLRGQSTRDATATSRTDAPVVLIAEDPIQLDAGQRKRLGVEAMLHAPLEIDDVARTLHGVFLAWREAHPDVPLADASNLAR